MTDNSAQSEQFTGLILLTGTDKAGIATSLFETLAPFAVHIIDIEQIVINNRLILTVLIGASPAHQGAIEEDLNSCALELDVDIATVFGKGEFASLPRNTVEIHLTASKLHPRTVAQLSKVVTVSGGNIERVVRISDEPTGVCLTISGLSKNALESALASVPHEDAVSIAVNEL